jgi:hypothetical protein
VVIITTGMTVGGGLPDIISPVRMAATTDTMAGMVTAVTGADGPAMGISRIRATFTSIVIRSDPMAILATGTTAPCTGGQATQEMACFGAHWPER